MYHLFFPIPFPAREPARSPYGPRRAEHAGASRPVSGVTR